MKLELISVLTGALLLVVTGYGIGTAIIAGACMLLILTFIREFTR